MLKKAPVTTRALIQRINRKLIADDEVLKVARGAKLEQEVGRYFVLDVRLSGIIHKHVDPEELGRELGVLKPWEALAT